MKEKKFTVITCKKALVTGLKRQANFYSYILKTELLTDFDFTKIITNLNKMSMGFIKSRGVSEMFLSASLLNSSENPFTLCTAL